MSRYYAEPDGFVLRSPLLPFSTLESLLEGGTARAAWESGGDVAAAVEADRNALAERLRGLVDDPVVREAVFLASPSLDEELDRWKGNDTRPLRPLLSYVTRMTARSTPFGLFAGCSVGSIGPSTELRLGPTPTRATRLDFGFLAKVVSNVQSDANALTGLTFVPNTSLYRAGGRLRMAESRVDGRAVRYRRVTFEEDSFLTDTLERARGGAKLEELAAALVDDEVTIEEAREYVRELVDAQLLVADLGPTITGGEAVGHLVETLRPVEATAPVAEALETAARTIADLDAAGVGSPTSRYREIADGLRKLDPDLEISRLFQVDLARPSPELTLGPDMVNEIHRIIAALHPLSRGGPDEIAQFRDKFTERYEGREVPLAEALDEEIGIGYGPPPGIAAQGAPLLATVVPGGGRSTGPTMSSTDGVLLRMLAKALREGATEIALTDADLERLAAGDSKPLPDSASIFLSPAADGRMVLQIITGPSGARLLGRFCHVDPGIEALVRRSVEGEEAVRPAAVFAEVVHLPEGRIGNVIARPVLRAYEIPFLGRSGAPNDGLIPVDDLMVSVVGGRVVLRSKRLDREVLPRITNAHNHQTGALAIYRFLGALPQQDVAGGIRWSWGVFGNAPFLPRVTYGRFVLNRAEWNLSRDDLAPVADAKDDPVTLFQEVQKLREAANLPRWSVVAVADNELPVDLDSVGGCELFAHEARKMGSLKLTEMFPGPDQLAAVSPEGRHAAEIVVPLTRREPVATATPRGGAFGEDDTFPPGSEWLTVKWYGGPATADAVLREAVVPLVRDAGADRWFFLRYADPDQHLRLRFNADPQHLASVVLPAVHRHAEPLLADGRLWKVQVDTYRRETDRYGGPEAIGLAEDVFHADSEAILAIVAAAEGDDGLDARWRLAVVGVDKILDDLGVDIATRQLAVRAWRDGLVREQGGTGTSAHRWAGKLARQERAKLDALLNGQPSDQITAVGLQAYARRSEAVAPVAVKLNELAAAGRLSRPVPDIAQSFAHLHAIRLLRAVQRIQEIVVYDLLDRLYSARKARAAK